MRILFVSSTTVGGSGRSQRELASRLADLGHEVAFLVDDARPARLARWLYGHLSDAAVRFAPTPVGSLVDRLASLPGRKPHRSDIDGLRHTRTHVPENSAATALDEFQPDVVIGNSILRLTWRKTRELCRQHGIATVLYIREVETLNHFDEGVLPADAVVANAESLARRVEDLGFPCSVFPSVIETAVTTVESTRRCVLTINPIGSRGIETVWQVAARLPDIPFVVQESWPLTDDQLNTVQLQVTRLPNVEFRRAQPPGPQLYGDARVLLVPYRVDNRPRVIAEAQANAIPVIVADSPALVEATGAGGIAVDADDIDAWRGAIADMWEDEERYRSLSDAARRHSTRDEISAAAVAARFEVFLQELVATRG